MPDIETQVAVMASDLRNHISADEKGQGRIDSTLTDIKNMVGDLSKVVRESTQRMHERMDQEAKTARENTAEAVRGVREEIKATATETAEKALLKAKVWSLTGGIAGISSAIWSLVGGGKHP